FSVAVPAFRMLRRRENGRRPVLSAVPHTPHSFCGHYTGFAAKRKGLLRKKPPRRRGGARLSARAAQKKKPVRVQTNRLCFIYLLSRLGRSPRGRSLRSRRGLSESVFSGTAPSRSISASRRERFRRPLSSISSTLTLMMSPTLTTSVTFSVRLM